MKLAKINKWFGEKHVLKDVSLEFPAGQTTVLVGPSGSGKSTILRSLNLLEQPDRGTYDFDKLHLNFAKSVSRKQKLLLRQKTGMVFQDYNLFPHLTVLQNVTEGPIRVLKKSKEAANQEALEILSKVGLCDFAGSYPAQLSGGQQQRVAIARSMATQPQLILMDESFSALDPVLRAQQQDLLLNLHRQSRTTVVFVTHDMQEALRLGDRIAVINNGQLQQIGSPNEILEQPANQFVADFFATARPRLGTMTALLSSKLVQKTSATDQSVAVATVAELASLTPDSAGWLHFQYQGQDFQIQTTDLLHYLGQREDR